MTHEEFLQTANSLNEKANNAKQTLEAWETCTGFTNPRSDKNGRALVYNETKRDTIWLPVSDSAFEVVKAMTVTELRKIISETEAEISKMFSEHILKIKEPF